MLYNTRGNSFCGESIIFCFVANLHLYSRFVVQVVIFPLLHFVFIFFNHLHFVNTLTCAQSVYKRLQNWLSGFRLLGLWKISWLGDYELWEGMKMLILFTVPWFPRKSFRLHFWTGNRHYNYVSCCLITFRVIINILIRFTLKKKTRGLGPKFNSTFDMQKIWITPT